MSNCIPELKRLARQCAGEPEAALVQVLQLLCEQLQTDAALLGDIAGGVRTIRVAVGPDGRRPDLEGARPADETWSGRVTAAGSLVVRDAAQVPELAALEVTRQYGIRCYAGTVVRGLDGREVGVLAVLGHAVHDRLDDRDIAVLEGLGEVVGELYEALLRPVAARVPAPRRPSDLARFADTVTSAQDVEGMTRPLLDALHELSGIASTYLTVVHEDRGLQEIRYTRNAKPGFALPEGLHVPWADTLCKRALDEGRACTTDVPDTWPDSGAAADLGIVTYVSVPVRLADGRLWGTLCAADDIAHDRAAEQLPTLALFARLIAGEVERSAAVERERERATRARREADTDELTGCSSRRTVQPWLDQALDARRPDEVVVLAFVDVDAFKQVNDRFGHATGDEVLATLGSRLLGSARPGDLVARLGGDEFVVGARLPREAAHSLDARVRRAGAFDVDHQDGPVPVRCSTGLASSDDAGDAAALLSLSDAEMYRDKALSRC